MLSLPMLPWPFEDLKERAMESTVLGIMLEDWGGTKKKEKFAGGILFVPENESGMNSCYHAGRDINW